MFSRHTLELPFATFHFDISVHSNSARIIKVPAMGSKDKAYTETLSVQGARYRYAALAGIK